MALRNITVRGDEILTKKCKTIKAITPRIAQLAEDMTETMLNADGVGIAAPQVGVMKRMFIAMPHVESEDESIRARDHLQRGNAGIKRRMSLSPGIYGSGRQTAEDQDQRDGS